MEAARFAVEYLGLDQLLLVPAGIPPHKTSNDFRPEALSKKSPLYGEQLLSILLAAPESTEGTQPCFLRKEDWP